MMRRARPRPDAALAVVALAVLFGAVAAEAQSGGGGGFSVEERRLLRSGELVRRPVTRNDARNHFIGGTSWQLVRAPRDEVWAVVQDVSEYPRLIPGVEEARLDSETDDGRRVLYLRHRYAFVTASYYAIARTEPETHTVRFDLDPSRPHDVRAGRGFVTVDSYRGDQSIVTWGVMADVGNGILTGVFAPVVHDWILRVPWCVRGRVEPGQPGC